MMSQIIVLLNFAQDKKHVWTHISGTSITSHWELLWLSLALVSDNDMYLYVGRGI